MKFLKPSNPSKLSDEELILEFKKTGDKKLVGDLFGRYIHLTYGVCMKYVQDEDLCKDLCMEIFEKLMTELTVKEVRFFRTWIYMVAKNHCMMYHRKQKSELASLRNFRYDEKAVMESGDKTHLENVPLEENLNDVEEALAKLNKEQRTCIELFYIKDKCYQEISATTGFSMMHVKSHIQNGKRNLKILLLKKNEQRQA